jgi:tetratricopeptide (TPR) repeat protein
MSATDAYSKARKSARKALSINKYEPRAHKVLAYIHYFYDWDWDAALEDYERAIKYGLTELNEFILYYEMFANLDFDPAFEVAEKRVKTDPLDFEKHWQLGLCHFFAQNFETSVKHINDALELDPNYSNGHHWKGVALGYLGRYGEAIASLEKALEITGGEGLANLDLLAVKIQMGKKDEVLPVIESMEFIDPMDAAKLYTMMGMHERAIDWIEKGYENRSVMMVTLKNMWMWDPLRNEPRFVEIYEKMNF